LEPQRPELIGGASVGARRAGIVNLHPASVNFRRARVKMVFHANNMDAARRME
jgi:hypothetical protein